MNTHTHALSIGQLTCTIVNDGCFAYPQPGQLFFAEAPTAPLAQAFAAHAIDPATWESYPSPYPSLLIDTGEALILVDTGAGALAPTTGQLIPNLRALGVTPAQIDLVVLTHGHPDHIGGNLDSAGHVAFPNARWVMGRDEWAFWAADPAMTDSKTPLFTAIMRRVARTQLPPIQARLTLVDDGAEIAPGIQVVAAPGHTPGQIALRITSQGEQLLWAADTCFHPIHVEHPDWITQFDHLPDVTVATRRKLFGQAAADGALVQLHHLPFPGLGVVAPHADGWRWQPIGH